MSAGRLSSISSQTLSQVLERQRLQSLSQPAPSSQLAQITRNLNLLRNGIAELESNEEVNAARPLREQWERMRKMLGAEGESLESLPPPQIRSPIPLPLNPPLVTLSGGDPVHPPYADDEPPSPEPEPSVMLHQQRQMMDEQDTRLDSLSNSIHRQRDISLNIGSELDVHTGLLEDLENSLDRTTGRMSGARRRLDRVSRGARDNCSALSIGILIFVLLILIIVFKT